MITCEYRIFVNNLRCGNIIVHLITMEELSELCFNMGDPLKCVDELYSCMDNDSTDLGGNGERPPSIMSWTFSPISDDGSYNNTQDFSFVIPEHSSSGDLKTEEQLSISDILKTEPANQQIEYKTEQQHYAEAHNRYTQSVKQITSQMNNYSEYVYPNNITYHQSVNIHNYVGNYHNPAVWWDNQSKISRVRRKSLTAVISGGDSRQFGIFFNFAQTYFPSDRLVCYLFLP